MILAIDSGTTHITLGCVDETNTVRQLLRLPTDRSQT